MGCERRTVRKVSNDGRLSWRLHGVLDGLDGQDANDQSLPPAVGEGSGIPEKACTLWVDPTPNNRFPCW